MWFRAVNSFEFRLVTDETPNIWRQWKGHAMTRLTCYTGFARFAPAPVASVMKPTDTVNVKCILLSKRQYAVRIGDEIRVLMRLSHLHIAEEGTLI